MYSANCTAPPVYELPSFFHRFLHHQDWGAGGTSVAGLARVRHQRLGVQRPRLVVLRLEDGDAAHGRVGRSNQRKVLSSDAEKNLPG
jgi:hypothetical protein